MRILAGADFHGSLDHYRWFLDRACRLKVEALVLAGDLFGFADEVDDPGSGPNKIGSRAILQLIDERQPLVHIHGHSHSGFGCDGRHFNVALALGKRATLIDLDTLESSIVVRDSEPQR